MTTEFTRWPDLASRALAGSVVAANDESFAARENLISPQKAVFSAEAFGHKGKVYDGWETRRRREPGHDWAIVRLGVPGVVHGVVVDTAWFTGNYPPEVSVEAASVTGYPGVDELRKAEWVSLVGKSAVAGDSENPFSVTDDRRWTHVRLSIYPDGGVARFRVHGQPRPDPRLLTGTIDLAALENGGLLAGCSDAFYSSPQNLIMPGRARIMGDGWENARRRDDGNDWALFRLAGPGTVRRVEVDTSYFLGNAPGQVRVSACLDDSGAVVPRADAEWFDLVPRMPVQPDTRHQLPVAEDRPVSHARLDVYPDGGLARLRLWGELVTPPPPGREPR